MLDVTQYSHVDVETVTQYSHVDVETEFGVVSLLMIFL